MTAFGAPGAEVCDISYVARFTVASAGAASAKITISEALLQNGFP